MLLIQIWIHNDKQCRSRSVGFLEANWSGSTLFAKTVYIRVQQARSYIYHRELFKWCLPIYKTGLGPLILNFAVYYSRSTKFVQMMIVGWLFTFFQQAEICIPMHLYEENVEKSYSQNVLKTNGWNLHMIKVANPLVTIKIFSPGFICPCPWAMFMSKIV